MASVWLRTWNDASSAPFISRQPLLPSRNASASEAPRTPSLVTPLLPVGGPCSDLFLSFFGFYIHKMMGRGVCMCTCVHFRCGFYSTGDMYSSNYRAHCHRTTQQVLHFALRRPLGHFPFLNLPQSTVEGSFLSVVLGAVCVSLLDLRRRVRCW